MSLIAFLLAQAGASALAPAARPEDTEVWANVPIVTPGAYVPAPPPSDAIVLFDGRDLSQWASVKDGGPADWRVHDGVVTVVKGGGGNIETRRKFGSYQLHLEWQVPEGIVGEGQARGNSGVFLASTGKGDLGYEVQILDSYQNPTYANGQAGAIYKQFVPLANPIRPPGAWQSYDIVWTAPRFRADGAVERPAAVTVLMNGVLVQDHVLLKGPTVWLGQPAYSPHGDLPIKLQSHGDPSAPISFRNIWVRPLP